MYQLTWPVGCLIRNSSLFHSMLFGNFKSIEKWAEFRLKAAVNQIPNVDISPYDGQCP